MTHAPHPREILLGAQAGVQALPVCDHYSGVEVRMRKSLQLQAELMAEYGHCVFDVTLDCEDGAPVGKEREHAALVAQLVIVVKDTTFGYVVTYGELMQNAKVLIANYQSLVPVYLVVAAIYCLVNYGLSRASKRLGRPGW
jgi:hypothetical protein